MSKDNKYEIPENATIRQEHVRCGNPDCQQLHGLPGGRPQSMAV